MRRSWADLNADLTSALGPGATPIAITFSDREPAGTPRHDGAIPEATADGRTGRVAAGCVFWIHATQRAFVTEPADHFNCSVGSYTHGLKTLGEVVGNADVSAMLESGWVTAAEATALPHVKRRPSWIRYEPLAEAENPDVILLRVTAAQAMLLQDGVDDLVLVGKPQCHIVPLALEDQRVALSTGCLLSRIRTGMPNTEMTCTVPAGRAEEVVDKLRARREANRAVRAYASTDLARFQGGT